MSFAKTLPISRKNPAREIRVLDQGTAYVLRPTLMTDAEQISDAINASKAALGRFMPWSHAEHTPETQLARLKGCEASYWAGDELVTGLFTEAGVMLAMAGLHPRVELNPNALEVGYWAPTRHSGKGYTTLAVKVLALYAFDKLGCDRLQVGCNANNHASRRVIEKVGFEFEGTLRNITAAPTPELLQAGVDPRRENHDYALFPDTFAQLAWVEELRRGLTYVNLLGQVVA